MARKIIDTYPVFKITVGSEGSRYSRQDMTRDEAIQAREDFTEILKTLDALTRRNFDVESTIVEEATCEHCRSRWTEDSPAYNGGCCALDEANSPDALGAASAAIGTPISELSGRPGHAGFERFTDIASSWGYE